MPIEVGTIKYHLVHPDLGKLRSSASSITKITLMKFVLFHFDAFLLSQVGWRYIPLTTYFWPHVSKCQLLLSNYREAINIIDA